MRKLFALLGCGLSVATALNGLYGAPATPWHHEPGFAWQNLDVPQQGKTGFTLLKPEQTGIDFTNVLLEFSAATNRILENGAGVALGDYDQDGWLDIFVCGLDSPSALYRNLGNWRFTNVTSEAGLSFADRHQRGAVFADVNGDGALDLLVSTLNQGVLCFLNDGHGHFKDATATAGTATRFGSVTMTLADIDGNGTLDLYVANYRGDDIRDRGSVQLYRRNGQLIIPPELQDRLTVINGMVKEFGDPDILYLNDGQGHFTPVSWTGGRFVDESGRKLERAPQDWGQTASFRDLDGDGSPDLYVCNDFWTVDRVWMNDGHGNFRALEPLALRHVCFSSMGVDFADIDRDGYFDFLVTDMQSRDARLRKRQIFAYNPMQPVYDPLAPPSGIVPDRPQIMRDTLFFNRGDGTYADIADYAGVASADWAWQQIFLDVDLDGYEDLLIAAGFYRDVQDRDAIAATSKRRPPPRGVTDPAALRLAFSLEKMTNSRLFPPYECPIAAFRNLGNRRFEETTAHWGTDAPGVHQGFAIGDLDNDGDMDLVVNNLNGRLGVYRNDSSARRVAVRLKGLPPNTQGIGAQVKLLGGAVPMQSQEIVAGGRYLSGSQPMITFAAGNAEGTMRVEVWWRSGKRSLVESVRSNRLYEIDEAAAKAPVVRGQLAVAERRLTAHFGEENGARTADQGPRSLGKGQGETSGPTLFLDVSDRLKHSHFHEPFDDFTRQPLLPRKLSQLGPGVAWCDLNQDGHEDLVIGSGQGGNPAVYLNDGRGNFQRVDNPFTKMRAAGDQMSLLGLSNNGRETALIAALSRYRNPGSAGSDVNVYDWISQKTQALQGAGGATVGPLALGDLDGSGRLVLFAGGRVIPGRWPEAASSRIYRTDGETFTLDETRSRALEKVGLVSGAVFSDLDGDGLPELVLACEWGPIRVFHDQAGQLRDVTASLGLDKFTGWWNGVTTGDLDGDGRLDIVASNWGLNSPYGATPEHPTQVYFGDLGGGGRVDVVESEFERELNAVAPRRYRDVLMASLPFLAERFPTHRSYSDASIQEVLGDVLPRATLAQATTLSSMVFLNRGDHFEAVALPAEAQFAPSFGVVVADFNGDGLEDVFLSQNFFGTEPSTPRQDAGRGLLLLGTGKGGLRAVSGEESGIRIYGEQRSAAMADFNEDGRLDLVVTQNGGPTKLYENGGARPGLRVRLAGPPGNPTGIGAVLRLSGTSETGPAREVHAGSGYLSQDGAVQVLARPAGDCQLVVRWPGGKVTRSDVPGDATAVTVDTAGRLIR